MLAQVGEDRAAVGDRVQLQPAADAEHRGPGLPGRVHQRDLGLVPGGVVADVVAAGKDHAVNEVEQVNRV